MVTLFLNFNVFLLTGTCPIVKWNALMLSTSVLRNSFLNGVIPQPPQAGRACRLKAPPFEYPHLLHTHLYEPVWLCFVGCPPYWIIFSKWSVMTYITVVISQNFKLKYFKKHKTPHLREQAALLGPHLFSDLQSSFTQRLGFLVLPSFAIEHCKVIESCCHLSTQRESGRMVNNPKGKDFRHHLFIYTHHVQWSALSWMKEYDVS